MFIRRIQELKTCNNMKVRTDKMKEVTVAVASTPVLPLIKWWL